MSETTALKIDLSATSVVNKMSGEVVTPKESLDALQELEREITRCDETIESLKGAMRAAKEAHDNAVMALRVRIRESVTKDLLPFDQPDAVATVADDDAAE